jgi:hypothetical protein
MILKSASPNQTPASQNIFKMIRERETALAKKGLTAREQNILLSEIEQLEQVKTHGLLDNSPSWIKRQARTIKLQEIVSKSDNPDAALRLLLNGCWETDASYLNWLILELEHQKIYPKGFSKIKNKFTNKKKNISEQTGITKFFDYYTSNNSIDSLFKNPTLIISLIRSQADIKSFNPQTLSQEKPELYKRVIKAYISLLKTNKTTKISVPESIQKSEYFKKMIPDFQ